MLFNLYVNDNELYYVDIDFDEVCKLIESGIHKGKTFVVEILQRGFKQRIINDIIDYSEFVDEFGEV